MERQSCLTDRGLPVVADTSVLINLNATKCAKTILDALPNPLLVVAEVIVELKGGDEAGRGDAAAVDAWIASGHLEVVQLGGVGLQHFGGLVAGPIAQTLDDGEAATIAYALEREPHAIPLIDERKANRICGERFAGLVTGSTVDVLSQDDVQAILGRGRLAEAVFNALHDGRMRVLPHHLNWVVHLIGPDRVKRCMSLPRSVRRING